MATSTASRSTLAAIDAAGRTDGYTALSLMRQGIAEYKQGGGLRLTALGLAALAAFDKPKAKAARAN